MEGCAQGMLSEEGALLNTTDLLYQSYLQGLRGGQTPPAADSKVTLLLRGKDE